MRKSNANLTSSSQNQGAKIGNSGNSEGQTVPRSRNSNGPSGNSKKGGGVPQPSAAADKGPQVGGEGKNGSGLANNLTQSTNNENDAFNKHYNKELRVSKDEIPIVMAELNDSAYRFIKREQYERALNLLQKAYGIMDVIDFNACRRDKFHLFVMFHNMALCYQKMQMLEECASCIDQALENMPIDAFNLEEQSISNRMRKLNIITRLKMQFCAILSQIHRHKDALEQAREGVRLGHLLINDLRELCLFYIRREHINVSVNLGNQGNSVIKQDGAYENKQTKKGNVNSSVNFNSQRAPGVQASRNAAQRNRSFSSFLSQQEAYGAFESIPQGNGGNRRNNANVSQMSRGSQHSLSSFFSANQLENSMSYIEKTARKLFPILTELKKRMVPEKKRTQSGMPISNISGANRRSQRAANKKGSKGSLVTLDNMMDGVGDPDDDLILADVDSDRNSDSDQLFIDLTGNKDGLGAGSKQQTDMKNILGYLNQGEWTSKLSIGSIMQLQPYKIKDLIEQGQNELELTRESFIQKVSGLAVSYFCYSTEIRFIIQMKEDATFETPQKQKESEFWHAKSLELSCTFLPGECPLLNHINLSYQKHFAPVKTTIMEDQEQEDDLQVIKPLNGVDNTKMQPIIRKLSNVHISITPFQLTPLHQVTKQMINQMLSFNEYQEQSQNGLQENSKASGAVGQQILPPGLAGVNVLGRNAAGEHSQSMQHQRPQSMNLPMGTDLAAANNGSKAAFAVNQSMQEFDNFANDLAGNGPGGVNVSSITVPGKNAGETNPVDDLSKLDVLLNRLIDSKQITKKQLIQKLLSIGGGGAADALNSKQRALNEEEQFKMHHPPIKSGERPFGSAPDSLEERQNENILEDNSDEEGQRAMPSMVQDPTHARSKQENNTNNGFFKVRDSEKFQHMQHQDRPKSSKGGLRSSIHKQNSSGAPQPNTSVGVTGHQRSTVTNKGTLGGNSKSGIEKMASDSHTQGFHHSSLANKDAKSILQQPITRQGKRATAANIEPSNHLQSLQHIGGGHQEKHSKSSHVGKSKKDSRPLSGGIQQKVFSKHGERSRAQNAQHNMSMFDKIGSNAANAGLGPHSKLHGSPNKVDKFGKPSQLGNHHMKLYHHKLAHNSSFDNIGISNSLSSQQAHHNTGNPGSSKLVATSGANNNSSSLMSASAQQLVQAHSLSGGGAGGGNSSSTNPAAYDELKKRLLNEYKKLVNNKKSGVQTLDDSQIRETRSIHGKKKMSSRLGQQQTSHQQAQVAAHQQQQQNQEFANSIQQSSFSAHLAQQQQQSQHQEMKQGEQFQGVNSASGNVSQTNSQSATAAHLNVYKPTFIINNSFQGEHPNNQQPSSQGASANGTSLGVPGISENSAPTTSAELKKLHRHQQKAASQALNNSSGVNTSANHSILNKAGSIASASQSGSTRLKKSSGGGYTTDHRSGGSQSAVHHGLYTHHTSGAAGGNTGSGNGSKLSQSGKASKMHQGDPFGQNQSQQSSQLHNLSSGNSHQLLMNANPSNFVHNLGAKNSSSGHSRGDLLSNQFISEKAAALLNQNSQSVSVGVNSSQNAKLHHHFGHHAHESGSVARLGGAGSSDFGFGGGQGSVGVGQERGGVYKGSSLGGNGGKSAGSMGSQRRQNMVNSSGMIPQPGSSAGGSRTSGYEKLKKKVGSRM